MLDNKDFMKLCGYFESVATLNTKLLHQRKCKRSKASSFKENLKLRFHWVNKTQSTTAY